MITYAPTAPQVPRWRADEQTERLVHRMLATHSKALLRTANRHSLCSSDADDAFQQAMEIFLRRAPTLDPLTVSRWLHVVIKHEAMEIRRTRTATIGHAETDPDHYTSPHARTTEEHVIGADEAREVTCALKRLKAPELRAVWLLATGHSYGEIMSITGFSATKVNKLLTSARKQLLCVA